MRVEYDKLRANLTCTLALEKWDKTTKIFKVQCVACAWAQVWIIIVTDHGAVKPHTACRWSWNKLTKRWWFRNTTLQKAIMYNITVLLLNIDCNKKKQFYILSTHIYPSYLETTIPKRESMCKTISVSIHLNFFFLEVWIYIMIAVFGEYHNKYFSNLFPLYLICRLIFSLHYILCCLCFCSVNLCYTLWRANVQRISLQFPIHRRWWRSQYNHHMICTAFRMSVKFPTISQTSLESCSREAF